MLLQKYYPSLFDSVNKVGEVYICLCNNVTSTQTLTISECCMTILILSFNSKLSVGHLSFPHCTAVDIMPDASSVLI